MNSTEEYDMSRREKYSNFEKVGRLKIPNAQQQYKVFQCLNPNCTEIIITELFNTDSQYSVICPKCGYEHHKNGQYKLFSYSMNVDGKDTPTGEGEFIVYHDEYISDASIFKYCKLCGILKPIELFHTHSRLSSGHQSECKRCKKIYNSVKNPTRIPEQHAESGQNRRLMVDVTETLEHKLNRKVIEKKYGYKCFCCGKDLSRGIPTKERPIDHTLPVYYLWPATTENATLLCFNCNEKKKGKWPSEFYDDSKIRELSVLTGYSYELLSGDPVYNPDAIKNLNDSKKVDNLIVKYAKYMDRLIKLRNRILCATGYDFFAKSTKLAQSYIDQADKLLNKKK